VAKPRLFVTRQLPGDALKRLEEYYEVVLWPEYQAPPYEKLLEEAKKSDALVTLLTDRADCNLIELSPRLRIIAQYAVGYDNIDIDCATRHGVYVTNTPGVLTDATADLTWALILAAARRIVEADRFVRSGEWYKTRTGWHPMMMLGVEDVPLEKLLAEADIVTIHTPLTPETRGLMNRERIRMMKKGAILVNTARGKIVDLDALVEALKDGHLAAAGLDVFPEEPLPPDHPITKLDNVVLTPHIGSATWETRTRMADLVAENLIAFYKGQVPPTLVNRDVVKVRSPGFA